jgi:hypothetical protein
MTPRRRERENVPSFFVCAGCLCRVSVGQLRVRAVEILSDRAGIFDRTILIGSPQDDNAR